MKKYILEITTFVCGAVVMVYELVGSRILGPYFGTSMFVWTALIGIILASLSLGYYFGGKIADKNPNFKILSIIIFLSGLCIILTFYIKDDLLFLLQKIIETQVASIMASIILFLPTSLLLGMVSPYVVKLKMESLNTTGKTVGNLYAISTIGSIIGTFFSGFYLIPHYGTNQLLIILSAILIIISIIIFPKKSFKNKLIIFVIFFAIFSIISTTNKISYAKKQFIDIDTAYSRIWIYDRIEHKTNKLIKTMGINNENHSSMFLDSNELVNEYTKYYALAKHFNPDFKKTLIFGGAGYSYPKYFLEKYPDATIDVVEIDPMVTELAKKYFRLKENPNIKIYHEDGRVYLNRTNEKYDVIFGDAFGSRYSIPYQLTTKEAIQKQYDILKNNGVIILNLISAIDGDAGQFLRAELKTYKSIFPQVYIFPVKNLDEKTVQNIILVALKSKEKPVFKNNDEKLNEYLNHLWKKNIETDVPILTDNFAPVDYYINKINS